MKIAVLQSTLVWENPKANRDYFEEKINSLIERVNLIVLPEMFSTGFTMNPRAVAETMRGETLLWMQNIAQEKKSAITGSIVIVEGDCFYNRMFFVYPSGETVYYDKKHLFTLAGEDKVYTAGKQKLIVNYLGWKICPMVCYDLRFPVFSRNVENYDLLLYVASWPEKRIKAWDALLKARAIENMSYVVGVNIIGTDGNQHQYSGHTQVVDCLGEYLLEPSESEGVFVVVLDREKALATRKALGFLKDKDDFQLL